MEPPYSLSSGSNNWANGPRPKQPPAGNNRWAQETVKLATGSREREQHDNMADLYAIIKTTEVLEKAYVRDAITADQYKLQCAKLIAQFRAAQNLCADTVPDVRQFMADHRLECKAAVTRLIEDGVPLAGGKLDDPHPLTIAETVQLFITAMDSLKLNQAAADQLHPLLADLLDRLSSAPSLPAQWPPKLKLQAWLVTLNGMQAADELSEAQVRQLLFDLDQAYSLFHRSLAQK